MAKQLTKKEKRRRAHIAIGAGAALLLGVGGYLLLRKNPAAAPGGGGQLPQPGGGGSQPDKNGAPAGVNARAIAQRMYEALAGWGTDEAAVFAAVREIQTQADWNAVKAAYTEVSEGCTFCERSLVGALEDDLDASEIRQLKDLLSKKGITI